MIEVSIFEKTVVDFAIFEIAVLQICSFKMDVGKDGNVFCEAFVVLLDRHAEVEASKGSAAKVDIVINFFVSDARKAFYFFAK